MRNILVAFGVIAAIALSSDALGEPVNDLMSKASVALSEADYQKAADLYTAVLKENPDNREARINRGLCYNKLNQPKKAENDFLELCAASPRDYEARYGLGHTYFAVKRYKDAFIVFDELAQINPEQPCLLAAAHSAFACRMYGTAAKYYRDARALTEDKVLVAQIDVLLNEAISRKPAEDKKRAARQAELREQERIMAISREQAAQYLAETMRELDAELTRRLHKRKEVVIVKYSSSSAGPPPAAKPPSRGRT